MGNLIGNLSIHFKEFSFSTYFLVFIGGVAISFTPCVYPLIPLVIGYIGGQKEKSRLKIFILSLLYILGMAVTYSILGLTAALTGKIFGEIQNSPVAHMFIGNILIFFGLSSLGVFRFPFISFSGVKKIKGLGSFGMGLVSGLITSPCVSPVLGGLLTFIASKQNVFYGATLLFVFSLGMGSFLLFVGTFSGLLGSLPKSGRWMERVERFFGFFMIIVGEYFLVKAGYLLI